MTTVKPSHLVLLDLNDEHKQFDQYYNADLFTRFTDRNRCILHVLSTRPHVRLLHFFIPNVANNIIQKDVALFQNTIFYIYCINDESVKDMEELYNYPMFVKIFHIEWLSTYLQQAAIIHLSEQSTHTNERDRTLQTAVELVNRLTEDFSQYMINGEK